MIVLLRLFIKSSQSRAGAWVARAVNSLWVLSFDVSIQHPYTGVVQRSSQFGVLHVPNVPSPGTLL